MTHTTHDWSFQCGRLGGGVSLYLYQIAIGISLRYWPETGPSFRLHFGPLKLWLYCRMGPAAAALLIAAIGYAALWGVLQ